MSATKRRLNFTGRKRITRDKVDIVLRPLKPNEPLVADVSIDFTDADFPKSAGVVLEAYQRSSGQRFSLGTVGGLSSNHTISISEIDLSGSVLFRLQVVDLESENGKILGAAERLRPRSSDDPRGKRSLLPIRETDLEDLVWKLQVDDDAGPELLLNYRIPGFKQRLLESTLIQGIILPAALRIILEKLASDRTPDDDEADDWKALWGQFVVTRLKVADDPSEMISEDKEAWVEHCVQVFCGSKGLVEKICRELEED